MCKQYIFRSMRITKAFSLIQISLLLTVASLVLVTALPRSQNNIALRGATAANLNTVLFALRQYQSLHGRLPCPADASVPTGSANYGVEGSLPGPVSNCTGGSPAANFVDAVNHVAIGMVPVKELNLAPSAALDSYVRTVTYAVDTNATALGWNTVSLPGAIAIADHGSIVNNVAALVSHGSNGHGAWIPLPASSGTATRFNNASSDADELTNAHVDGSFTTTTTLSNFVTKELTSTFDDMVVYRNQAWNLSTMPKVVLHDPVVTPPANGAYSAGQSLTFTLAYAGIVTVTGTPRIGLSAIGTGNHVGTYNTAYANYVSGSGSSTLTFTYVIQSGDAAPSGIKVASFIDSNGGTLKSGPTYIVKNLSSPDLTSIGITTAFIWADDAVPAGATLHTSGSASGNWVSGSPAPYSGMSSLKSVISANDGSTVWFDGATATMSINTGDTLLAYVYLDPNNPPSWISLAWEQKTAGGTQWNSFAYWGTPPFSGNESPSFHNAGPLPQTGVWTRLTVPASAVALEGTVVDGISFQMGAGVATFDQMGKY